MEKKPHSPHFIFLLVITAAASTLVIACFHKNEFVPLEVRSEASYIREYNSDRFDPSRLVASTSKFVPSFHVEPEMQPSSLLREVKVYKDLIAKGTHARKVYRPMNPRYITIHSTQNYASGADAWRHSLAQKNGKLRASKRVGGNRIGYLSWHYSVDQNVAVQHLPDNEQGEHADFNGPGNNYSIGVEMCENAGNSRAATLDRTAKLIAYLMYKHKIPIENVVAHYHWARKGLEVEHKNCPHFLMENGVPGRKWYAYKDTIQDYYDMITVKR
ncbi:N-acetylmuramoyl-L-alanine amidase [Akkermansiaceae bacterium]|nr:N-acetylmuramoyl-L-alanine amidase [Akkermansiaceae bacterium]